MRADKPLRALILVVTLCVALPFLNSCRPVVTKGDVSGRIIRELQVNATKADVLKYVDSFEVNGVKAVTSGYFKDDSGIPLTAPHGEKVDVEGMVVASFKNGWDTPFNFCPRVSALFYFDKSDRLIACNVDCFGR